jgi:hypothetical protein
MSDSESRKVIGLYPTVILLIGLVAGFAGIGVAYVCVGQDLEPKTAMFVWSGTFLTVSLVVNVWSSRRACDPAGCTPNARVAANPLAGPRHRCQV